MVATTLQQWIFRRRTAGVVAALGVALLAVSLFYASTARADGVPLAKGDVLAGVGRGIIKHFDANGNLLDELNNTRETQYVTGMCFDSSSNLYATDFFGGMSKFDQEANLVAAEFGESFAADPESCAVDAANNIYVGQADGTGDVLKFDSSGKLLASFAPAREDRGTDWVDLASDGCTLHYTSEGDAIKAYNVCTEEQLPDVATELPGPCYAHRILADGSELVACTAVVEHVNAKGEVIHTYELEGGSTLFALNLDPDGSTFWTGDLFSGQVWRVDIATGEVVKTFNSSVNTELGGLTIVGEITQTPRIELAPVTAENEVGTTHTVTATVTEEGKAVASRAVKFVVTGANAQTGEASTNSSGEAAFTYTGVNVGTDEIVASFEDKAAKTHESNTVKKVWVKAGGGELEPTTTSTSLSAGGQSGSSITVPEGTAVTDQATIAGTNAGSATGTVSYKVYSDSDCTIEAASAGTVTVAAGSAPASDPVSTLAQGKYYWQATYSGDGTLNEGSQSVCGSEVEVIGPPPPPPCTKVIGSAKVVIRKEGETERQKVEDKLSTTLTSKQKLLFTWENGASKLKLNKLTSASCVVSALKKKFSGEGEVTVNGEPGWHAKFYFVLTTKQTFTFHIRLSRPGEESLAFTDKAANLTSEIIS